MSHNTDDPKLTAYAIGELDDTERKAVEAHIATCADCRKFVEETKATAGLLSKELAKETGPGLTEAQRRTVEAQAKSPAVKPFRRTLWLGLATAAAGIIVCVSIFHVMDKRVEQKSVTQDSVHYRVPDQTECYNSPVAQPSSPKTQMLKESLAAVGNAGGRRVNRMMAAGVIQGDESLPPGFNTESYDNIKDNPFKLVNDDPLSTFSIDVDTASYSNVRRFLMQNQLPPKDSVRIEELVNYFTYTYSQPRENEPFSVNMEVAGCPWNPKHRLVRIGLKGREIAQKDRPASSLVFLLDVSGSMQPPNKLPLIKAAMKMLVDNLTENDNVAIAVYAGAAGLVLPSTSCDKKETIIAALDQLQAGGSTQGSAGITLAYETAAAGFIKGGTNRVIICTDGDFNVGVTNQGDLTRMIEEKAKGGVFLSVLGFGMGNYKDSTLEKLADKGNGNYGYIDDIKEARKVLVEQMGGTLITIAKDVKIQVEFNPAKVGAYRLIGYENRMLANQDFNDDKKDAGEIGSGHTVTALYELVPAGEGMEVPGVDPLKYQKKPDLTNAAATGETMTVKLRYKEPDGDTSKLLEFPVTDGGRNYTESSEDYKFAASVAAFGMVLRDSEYKGTASLAGVLELGEEGKGADAGGYRAEFLGLVKKAQGLMKK
jgi:Ca-activated chloride channel family protein